MAARLALGRRPSAVVVRRSAQALAPVAARAAIERANPPLARVLHLVAPSDGDLARLAAIAAHVVVPSSLAEAVPAEVVALNEALAAVWRDLTPGDRGRLRRHPRTGGAPDGARGAGLLDAGLRGRRRDPPPADSHYEADAQLGRGGAGQAALGDPALCASASG